MLPKSKRVVEIVAKMGVSFARNSKKRDLLFWHLDRQQNQVLTLKIDFS